MSDQEIVRLVRKWCGTRQREQSEAVCKEIAAYAGLPCPETEDEHRSVLKWVNEQHPEAYLEATRPAREFWGIQD